MNDCKVGDLVLLEEDDISAEELGIIKDIYVPTKLDIKDGLPRNYAGCIYEIYWLGNCDVSRELVWEAERFRASFVRKYGNLSK